MTPIEHHHQQQQQQQQRTCDSTGIVTATTKTNTVTTNPYVYIHDKEQAWIPGRLLEMIISTDPSSKHQNEAMVEIMSSSRKEVVTVALKDYPNQSLPLQNIHRYSDSTTNTTTTTKSMTSSSHWMPDIDIVDDMVQLNHLHEASILYNLRQRHALSKPYTRTGYNLMMATNPYQWLTPLYTGTLQHQYTQQYVYNNNNSSDNSSTTTAILPPHVYEVSALAYKGLLQPSSSYDHHHNHHHQYPNHQSILVSGESGAGKTETVKICLNHFATISESSSSSSSNSTMTSETPTATTTTTSMIVQRILDSNPLLEAFGNATTIKNDNSSRFGKYIQLQFDIGTTGYGSSSNSRSSSAAAAAADGIPTTAKLVGSTCNVYLLEKSRVVNGSSSVSSSSNERNYHIFYQLLAANDTIKSNIWDGLIGTTPEAFAYTCQSKHHHHPMTTTTTTATIPKVASRHSTNPHPPHMIEGRTDAEWFSQTIKALHSIGIVDDTFQMLFQSICIVLQLGNLIFASNIDDKEGSMIITTDELDKLAQLMGIPSEQVPQIHDAMTYRTIEARNEIVRTKVTAERAKDACDALAKEIYHSTFLWLVEQINIATTAPTSNGRATTTNKFGTIGLLDIFGFESFEQNGFEQLCINYANEMLQQKFTQDIFTTVMYEYEMEGIVLSEITYNDNRNVLDCIESRNSGLIAILNEESFRPNGNDSTFVYKAITANSNALNHTNNDTFKSSCFITNKLFNELQFGIQHYAGVVIYNATNFVMKNTDHIPHDVKIIAKLCVNNAIISQHMLQQPPNTSNYSSNNTTNNSRSIAGVTVWTKFRNQLHTLMKQINTTQTRYIRCIKPNNLKAPLVMDNVSTLQQLRCAGVVAAVTISRSAFPNRLHNASVLEQFNFLWPKSGIHSSEQMMEQRYKADITTLFSNAFKDFTVKEELSGDGMMIKKSPYVIGHTRTYFRAGALEYLESQRLRGMSLWAVEIQKVFRGIHQRRKYKNQIVSIIRLQTQYRRYVVRKNYVIMRRGSVIVQSLHRRVIAKRMVAHVRQMSIAAMAIQRTARGFIQRPKYRKALEKKKTQATMEYQIESLKVQLLEEEERWKAEYEKEQEVVRRQLEGEMREQMKVMQHQLVVEEEKRKADHERHLSMMKKQLEEDRRRKLEEDRLAMELTLTQQKMKDEEARQKADQQHEQAMIRRKMQEDAALQIERMKLQMAEDAAHRKQELERELQLSHQTALDDRIRTLEAERLEMQEQLRVLRDENNTLNMKNEAAQLAIQASAMNQVIAQEREEKARAASPQPVVEPDVQIVEIVKYVENEDSNKILAEQQGLMEESSKIIEFLRNENLKLKKKMEHQKKDFATMKDNNQRLMEANSSAGVSFNSLNQHAKQLNATNQKLVASVAKYRNKITQLHADMKHRQTYYRQIKDAYQVEAEVRTFYEKTMLEIVNVVTKKECKQACDPALHKMVMSKALACAKMSQKLIGYNGDDATVMIDNEPPPITSVEIYNDTDDALNETMAAI